MPKIKGCPRCGGLWSKQSGMLRCSNPKCGFCPECLIDSFDQKWNFTVKEDSVTVASKHPPGRRDQPLKMQGRR